MIRKTSVDWKARKPSLKSNKISLEDLKEYSALVNQQFGGDWNWTETYEATRALFRRSWWRRAWIVQEVCASTGVVFLTSNTQYFAWSDLLNFRSTIMQCRVSLGLLGEDTFASAFEHCYDIMECVAPFDDLTISKIIYQKKKRDENGVPSLADILSRLRAADATDIRDKVYSGLGLSVESHKFLPDYALSVREVFTKAVSHSIRTNGNLNILGHCKYPPSRPDLPSWVPDWSDRTAGARVILPQKNVNIYAPSTSAQIYAAGGQSVHLDCTVDEEQGTLFLKGCQLDSIAFLSRDKAVALRESALTASAPRKKLERRSYKANQTEAENEYDRAIVMDCKWLVEWARDQQLSGIKYQYIEQDGWQFNAQKGPTQFLQPIYSFTNEPIGEAYTRTIAADVLFDPTKRYEVRMTPELAKQEWELDFSALLALRLDGRKLAFSTLGLMALVPEESARGDVIAIAEGAEAPLILRPASHGRFVFIGECYVHGIMDGEIYDCLDRENDLETMTVI